MSFNYWKAMRGLDRENANVPVDPRAELRRKLDSGRPTQSAIEDEGSPEPEAAPQTGDYRDLGGEWTRDSQGRLVTPHNRVRVK